MAVKFAKSASTWGICNNNDNDPDLCAESGQTLQGSFSAVSKPNFASKYSLELAICSKRRLRKGTWGETENENLDK